MIGRRAFTAGTAALLASASARAQGAMPIVGFLGFASESADRPFLEALREGLRQAGHAEGRTLRVVNRHAGGDPARFAPLIAELVALPVSVFVVPGPTAARALKRTTSIPVVSANLPSASTDPDLYENLARPGGSVTGFSAIVEELWAKRIGFLQDMQPGLSAIGVMRDRMDPTLQAQEITLTTAIRAAGLRPLPLEASIGQRGELALRLREMRAAGGAALLVMRDPVTATLRDEICAAATAEGVAIVSESRDFAESGALFFYGADLPDLFRRAAGYVDRILKGDKPGDLPIQLPTKFELVINQKSAAALALSLPPGLLAQADEVIE
jgi:putative ABC transport system substrate-binding protein